MKRDNVTFNKTAFGVATFLFFAVVLLLLVSANMQKGLSHDEHMYVAGGEMLARDGLLPYRDYSYLQMPNLALLYGVLFQATESLLLAARLLNTCFAVLLLGTIFYYAATLLHAESRMARWLIGAGSVVLVLANPLFVYTSGLAWNHDLPLLLIALAFVLYSRAGGNGRAARSWVVCGVLVGLAIGTRLSFVLAVIPFVAGIFVLAQSPWSDKLRLAVIFFAGAFLGLLPSLLLAGLAPAEFMFGNWEYHRLNQLYWQQAGYDRAMDFWGKLVYLKEVAFEPGTMSLLVLFVLLALAGLISTGRRQRMSNAPLLILVLLILALLTGALVPTPTWYQYYYALVPFLVIGIIHTLSLFYDDRRARRLGMALFTLAVLVSASYGLPAYLRAIVEMSTEGWIPSEVHRVGTEIKQAVGDGKVATLASLYPMEGGVRIYKELASGPFGWRVSGLVSDRQEMELGILSPGNLEEFFRVDPPQGILVGFEGTLEQPLIEYAMTHGYRPLKLSNEAMLWLQSP